MQSYQNWLKYWKNSLADAQRLHMKFEKGNPLVLPYPFRGRRSYPTTEARSSIHVEEQKLNQIKGIKILPTLF